MTAIIFQSLFPVVWVIIISIVVLCTLGWLEIKRKQKLLIPRLTALFLAIVSLTCFVLNPVRTVNKSSDIILLTKSFNKPTLDSLLNVNANSQVYQLEGTESGNTAIDIKNYRELADLKGNLFVLGEGVPNYMLDYLDTSSVLFYPSKNLEGFTSVSSAQQYHVDQPGVVEGTIEGDNIASIKLSGAGIAEDSVKLNAKNSQSFSLSFTPKAAGLYLYALTASDTDGKVIHSEQMPVEVLPQRSLSILILTDYPSAEIRFLKNFLETQNHKLTLRYKMSKDKYRTEFVNTDQRQITRVNEPLLSNFDLVVTDVLTLTILSGTETQALKESQKSGLGILTLINTTDVSKSVKNFLELNLAIIKTDSAQLTIQKQRLRVPATSLSISSDKKIFTIQQEDAGRVISGYHVNGLGKSGFQLLINTYSLALAGEKETYAKLWGDVLTTLARKDIKKYDLSFTSLPPYYKDEPVEFKIVVAGEKPNVNLDSIEVSITEDPFVKNVWYGKIWAGQTGWSTLNIKQDSSKHNFFVSDNDAWKNLSIINQQQALQKVVSQTTNSSLQTVHKPVSLLIFFIIFLFTAGFLWLAPKL